MLRIVLASVFVDDQRKALAFYTDVLGFVKKTEIPLGESLWLTVASAADPNGVELLLEPSSNQIAQDFQRGAYEAGIPATSFAVDDIDAEYHRLSSLGVRFTTEPTQAGPVTVAIFDDTCGNLIQIAQGAD